MDEEQGVFERLTSSNLKMWSFSALRAFNNYISFQKRFSFLLPFSQFPKNVSSSFFSEDWWFLLYFLKCSSIFGVQSIYGGFTNKKMPLNLLKWSTSIAHLWWSWWTMQSTFNFYPSFQLTRALRHCKFKPLIKSIAFYLFRYKGWLGYLLATHNNRCIIQFNKYKHV